MGYDLIPRNKKIKSLCIGAFSWPVMLDMGIGLIISTGPAMRPAAYSYIPDKKGRDPNSNDGFYVNSDQAKAMSMVADGLICVNKFIMREWDKLSEEDKKQYEKYEFYKKPKIIKEDFYNLLERFSEFAKNSQGFYIK